MKKIILIYGLLGGVLIAALKLIEYRFLVVEHSLAVYGGSWRRCSPRSGSGSVSS